MPLRNWILQLTQKRVKTKPINRTLLDWNIHPPTSPFPHIANDHSRTHVSTAHQPYKYLCPHTSPNRKKRRAPQEKFFTPRRINTRRFAQHGTHLSLLPGDQRIRRCAQQAGRVSTRDASVLLPVRVAMCAGIRMELSDDKNAVHQSDRPHMYSGPLKHLVYPNF